jgi:hypothetical protein
MSIAINTQFSFSYSLANSSTMDQAIFLANAAQVPMYLAAPYPVEGSTSSSTGVSGSGSQLSSSGSQLSSSGTAGSVNPSYVIGAFSLSSIACPIPASTLNLTLTAIVNTLHIQSLQFVSSYCVLDSSTGHTKLVYLAYDAWTVSIFGSTSIASGREIVTTINAQLASSGSPLLTSAM